MTYLQYNPDHPAEGMWDQAIIKQLFNQECVFVIPGAYQSEYVDMINHRLAKEPYCVVIVSSDEEGKFPIEQLSHPHMIVYTQYHDRGDRQIPIGAPFPAKPSEKTINYFYAGQVNSEERKDLEKVTSKLKGVFLYSEGFSQGYPRDMYNDLMSHTKIVPCPAGWIAPDSFRLYEALEAGCTPVILSKHRDYFFSMFNGFPFPVVNGWSELRNVEYQDYSVWWKNQKLIMKQSLKEDLEWLKSQL